MEEIKKSCFSRKVGKAEWAALVLYLVGIAVVGAFHEPWFDEAQAWQIARCASVRELLTYIPHYEGHPPLWHLLLAIFAKNGFPFEITVKTINILFCTGAMAVLLFRSPYPKLIRCLLPFNFFFFYQFGVVSRPYGIFMLACMLASAAYHQRNAHPWRYILPLMLLCLSSAYGILIAGGFCVLWTTEIFPELYQSKKLSRFWKDRRFLPLLCILILAILLFFTILPAEDVYYDGMDSGLEGRLNALNNVISFPFECLWGNYVTGDIVKYNLAGRIMVTVIGAFTWFVFITIAKANDKLWVFLAPYGFYSIFVICSFSAFHHIGISTIILTMVFWIILGDTKPFRMPAYFHKMQKGIEKPLFRKLEYVFAGLLCIIPVFYSVVSAVNDIRLPYGPTELADFIKENHLEDTRIMMGWYFTYEEPEDEDEVIISPLHYMPSDHAPIDKHYPYIMGYASSVLPYFDRNIFMNFNSDRPDDMYMHYQMVEDEEAMFASWGEMGLPDFIVNYIPLELLFDEETLKGVRYVAIKEIRPNIIRKLDNEEGLARVFIREDLLDEYPQFESLYRMPVLDDEEMP